MAQSHGSLTVGHFNRRVTPLHTTRARVITPRTVRSSLAYASHVKRALAFVDPETGLFAYPRGDIGVDAAGADLHPSHCCVDIAEQVTFQCTTHTALGGCGDYLIGYHPAFDEYGIWIHTGEAGAASGWEVISHCTYCGTHLPTSRRSEWYDRLDAEGIDPEDAPADLQRYGWWVHS